MRRRRVESGVEPPAPLESSAAYVEPTFQAWVHDMKGDKVDIMPLDTQVFDQQIRADILHRNVVYETNKELGWTRAQTLTRGEISGSGKKPYQQKGTGRARRGTMRAPHHRGGGKAHGPVYRDRTTKLPRKLRRLGSKIALAARYQEDNFFVIDELKLKEPKTYAVAQVLKNFGWEKESVLFVVEEASDANFVLACRNLPNVETVSALRFSVKPALLNKNLAISAQGLVELQAHLEKEKPFQTAVGPQKVWKQAVILDVAEEEDAVVQEASV